MAKFNYLYRTIIRCFETNNWQVKNISDLFDIIKYMQ